MIRFHQTFGAHAGRVTELDQETISFGRMPDCDVAFDPQADLDASGRHAEVVKQGDTWHVIDSGSRNGTWLNGQKVQRAVLSSGDEIEFGMGGPRVKVEIVGAKPAVGPRQVTGPMTPAPNAVRPGQPTAAATPVSVPEGLGRVDASAATVAAVATPVPVVSGNGGVTALDPPTHAATPNALGTGASSPGPATPIAGGMGPGGTVPASSPGPVAPGSSAGGGAPKQYGERTVGLMIQAAIAQQAGKTPAPRSTEEIRAIAAQGGGGGGGLKLVVAFLVVLVVLLTVGGGVLFWYLTQSDGGSIADTTGGAGVDLEAVALSISTQNANALYVLVEQEGDASRGVCVAFAVRPDLLATSAQCVLAMQEGRTRRATHFAVPNGGGGQRLSITQMWHHPGYVPGGAPSADVGIVQIAGTAGVVLALATMAQLAELEAAAPVFVFGFAGDLSNVAAPVAGVATGTVRGITAFDGSQAPLPTAQVILHDAQSSSGTRGSPVFDASGRVVAIDEGGHAVRIDLLASLLAGMGR